MQGDQVCTYVDKKAPEYLDAVAGVNRRKNRQTRKQRERERTDKQSENRVLASN